VTESPPVLAAPSGTAEHDLPRTALLTLGALTAVAPLVTDLYLPGLPDLARSLGTSDALGQLTMSVCLVGLACGQLVAGPLSDRVGRMRPLRWGVAVLALSSFLCAVASDIGVLLALRLAQGLAGAFAMVIARAIVRDVYDGARAARVFSELMLVMGLAPIIGPLLGGQLLTVTDWRGVFVALGLLCVLLLLASWRALTETRSAEVRAAAPHRPRALRSLLADGRFRGFMALGGLFGAVLFTYISMGSFVLRGDYGLGPVAYAATFGLCAFGMIVGSQLAARNVARVGPARLLTHGVRLIAAACALAGAALVVDAPLPVVVALLWLVLAGLGASFGTSTALALVPHAADAGAAAALLGASQFLLGAAVPPLVSAGGASAPAMGVTMAAGGLVALAVHRFAVRPALESVPARTGTS